MKISEEFRRIAENPSRRAFFFILTPRAGAFARDQFGYPQKNFWPSIDLSNEEKTLAYLFLAAIAESEGL